MPNYRFPTLIWEDYEGFFTACTLEEHFAAVDRNPKKATAQIQDYLAWLYQEEPWRTEPEIHNATAQRFKVKIRPEYVEGKRVFPSEEVIELDVIGAVAEIQGGTKVCDLPMLGVHFYYYPSTGERTLTAMVSHHVRESLKSLTPGQLSQYLPPRSAELEEVVVRVNKRRKKQNDWEAFKTLRTVAERLDDPALRKQFSRAYERDKELQDLETRLVQEKANVLLVGESGCGKTAIVIDAARRLSRRKDLEKLLDAESRSSRDFMNALSDFDFVDFAEGLESPNQWQMWMTSGARLVAGMKYLGQWEERCEAIIGELSDVNGILCIENLRELILRGGQGPVDSLAAYFLPYLQRGELQMVCEATPAELAACRRWLPGFVEAFQILKLPDFDRVKAIRVLDRIAGSHRNSLHIEMEARVIQMVYRLFRRFMPYQAFPGKTVNFIREIFEKARKQKANKVTDQAVVEHFIKHTGLPELFIRDDITLEREDILANFRKQVIGQEQACQIAADLVSVFKAGMNDPDRPIGVYIFCGPTGVGKTQLAKTISNYFFGHGEKRDRLIRLDMSEYSGPGAAERLLTQSGGEPSDMINKIRQQPFAVLLLDEIEKANPEVFDVLLNVFDEGRLTDRYGRATTFCSTIIIMTSNLGSDRMDSIGFTREPAASYEDEVMSFFRPEFFNRMDGAVNFTPLTTETIRTITEKELAEIATREGLTKANLKLKWTARLVDFISKKGFDARYGARPLQRTLERLVVTPLAHFLVEKTEVADRSILVDVDSDNRVTIET